MPISPPVAARQQLRFALSKSCMGAAALLMLSGCFDDQSLPLDPELGDPSLALVSTTTSDSRLLATTDIPDAIALGGTATIDLGVKSLIGGGGGLDVVFLVDASGSLGSTGFAQEKDFVADVAADILSETNAGTRRIGVVLFASGAWTEWDFSSSQQVGSVVNAIQNLPYPQGTTWTRAAVQEGIDLFDDQSAAGTGKLMILVTDGTPNPSVSQDPCPLKPTLTSKGINVAIVGFGSDWTPSRVKCLVDNATTDIVTAANSGGLSAIRDRASSFISPIVNNVRLSGRIPTGFDLINPPAGYDAANRTFEWAAGSVGGAGTGLSLEISPTSLGVCGAVSAITGAQLFWTDPVTGSDFSDALPDVVTSVACPAPTVEASVAGTLGENGWYRSDVGVNWTTAFAVATTGCESATVEEDTEGAEFVCTATSSVGTVTDNVVVKRDATAPVVGWTGAKSSYFIGETISLICSATDATSGIAATDCANVTVAAASLGLGVHSYTASATDFAGNGATATVSFEVKGGLIGIETLLNQWITGPGSNGVVNALMAKLTGRNPNLGAFENQLRALEGKRLSSAQVATLMEMARAL